MLLVKGAHKGHAHDSHLLLRAILDYWHKNARDFEGTRELVAHKHQVAFELYCISLKSYLIKYCTTQNVDRGNIDEFDEFLRYS